MEENFTKALVIGVSLFAIMLTVSLVFTYYNTAKQVATQVGSRIDMAEAYDTIMTDVEKNSQYLTAVEIRQLIRKYANNETVNINIYSISNRDLDAAKAGAAAANEYYIEELLNNGMYENINNNWVNETTGMIEETYLSIIDPGWERNLVTKEIDGNITVLELSLDYRN